MADTYRIISHGPKFTINHNAGMTVGVYSTRQEALRDIEAFEQDDLMLETARSLVRQRNGFARSLLDDRRTTP